MNDLLGHPETPKAPAADKAWVYQRAPTGKDEWLTPPEIIKSLGEFDLDPCSPINRPRPTARHHLTIEDNGLIKPWHGRVWCNPPYERRTIAKWIGRCVEHRNVTFLVFAAPTPRFSVRSLKTRTSLSSSTVASASATSQDVPGRGLAAPGPPSARSTRRTPKP